MRPNARLFEAARMVGEGRVGVRRGWSDVCGRESRSAVPLLTVVGGSHFRGLTASALWQKYFRDCLLRSGRLSPGPGEFEGLSRPRRGNHSDSLGGIPPSAHTRLCEARGHCMANIECP